MYAQVVKEALCLLSGPAFEEANTEFIKAHRHLREGNQRDCNTAALRAVETVICDARGWTYQKGDAVAPSRGRPPRRVVPGLPGRDFDNLIGAVKAGVPKIRDR
jgi:hypothetical protein